MADFECKAGDTLVFREWDPNSKKYTGRSIEKRVRSVIRTKDMKYWKESEIERYGLQVIGLE